MCLFLKSATTATKINRGTCGSYFSQEGGDKND